MAKTSKKTYKKSTKIVRKNNLVEMSKLIKPCSVLLERIDITKFQSKPNIIRVRAVRTCKAKKEPESIAKTTEKNKNSSALVAKKNIKGKKLDSFAIGDDVLAKQKYSVPWPAKILAMRSKCVDVYFYGDGRKGPVKRDEIYSFNHSHDVILDCLRRNIPTYQKGIREMEMIHKVPEERSIIHRM